MADLEGFIEELIMVHLWKAIKVAIVFVVCLLAFSACLGALQ